MRCLNLVLRSQLLAKLQLAGESRPQVGNMAPKSGEIVQDASVTDESRSCLTPGLNSLVVAPEWLGCVYKGQ